MALPEIRVVSDADLSPEARLRRMLKVELEQEGADPTGLLLLLERAVKDEIWVTLGLPSFAALIEQPYPDGLGWRVDDVRTVMRLRHKHEQHTAAIRERMAWLRGRVTDLLNPAEGSHGTNQHTSAVGNTKSTENDASYALRRLKRDAPELAQRVLAGELSAHAAAIEAGFRPKTITVPLEPRAMARAIRRRLSDEDLDTLVDALGAVG